MRRTAPPTATTASRWNSSPSFLDWFRFPVPREKDKVKKVEDNEEWKGEGRHEWLLKGKAGCSENYVGLLNSGINRRSGANAIPAEEERDEKMTRGLVLSFFLDQLNSG